MSVNSSLTPIWTSEESHNTGAPVRLYMNVEVVPDPSCPKVFVAYWRLPENGGTAGIDNNHGAFDSNNFHLQPFSRFSSLLLNLLGSSCQ